LSADQHLAIKVQTAIDHLNDALDEAIAHGLVVDVDYLEVVDDCGRPDGPPMRVYSAKVSRPILATTK
jgi:hypothetical protein